MQQTSTMTIRLPDDVKARLERLAQATERTKAYLAAKAIEDYLATQEWQIQAIKEAVAQADSPNAKFIPHEEIVKKWQARLAGKKGRKR